MVRNSIIYKDFNNNEIKALVIDKILWTEDDEVQPVTAYMVQNKDQTLSIVYPNQIKKIL